jgi:CheY-like chemotaxis protein
MLKGNSSGGDFARSEIESAHMSAFRLRERLRVLATLSSSILTEECPARVVVETVKVLGVLGCSIQGVEENDLKKFGHCEDGLDVTRMNQVATALKAKVVSAGVPVTLGNLPARYPQESWIRQSGATKYLGVPLLTAHGDVVGVAGVFGSGPRNFNEDDEWWLQTAAQLVAAGFSYDALGTKMKELERVITPGSAESIDEAQPTEASDVRRPKILVIDDNRELNDLVCDVLTLEGYEVESAFNGVEAVQIFRPSDHNLAITDVAMPLMNGWELIAALRVRSPNLPIIVISGYSTGEWNPSYLAKQGVSAVLNKPLNLKQLTDQVTKLLPIGEPVKV